MEQIPFPILVTASTERQAYVRALKEAERWYGIDPCCVSVEMVSLELSADPSSRRILFEALPNHTWLGRGTAGDPLCQKCRLYLSDVTH